MNYFPFFSIWSLWGYLNFLLTIYLKNLNRCAYRSNFVFLASSPSSSLSSSLMGVQPSSEHLLVDHCVRAAVPALNSYSLKCSPQVVGASALRSGPVALSSQLSSVEPMSWALSRLCHSWPSLRLVSERNRVAVSIPLSPPHLPQ